jgi:hypothetical protein
MKALRTLALAASTALLAVGCAKMGTRQVDKNTTTIWNLDETGKTNSVTSEVRETSTQASGTALGAGQAALKGFRAKQDGGLQGLEIDESSQKTDGIAQAVQGLKSLSDIMRMMNGIPPSQGVDPATSSPREPARPQAPKGKKWVLMPKDEPSKPQPEEQ